MKDMLRDWERRYPGRVETIFTALQNIAPSQLADRNLFDFKALEKVRGMPATQPMDDQAGLDILAR